MAWCKICNIDAKGCEGHGPGNLESSYERKQKLLDLKNEKPRTIAQILNSSKLVEKLTDGKHIWIVDEFDGIKIGKPVKKTKKSFEIWASGLEQYAILPGLKKV